ncbi:MAG: MerR family transcriptional regulator, partial [Gaiellaceae bacterium]
RLARYGVAPRNLATFRRWADNEADLLERIVAPELRSPNPEKRHEGLENLETLAALSQELSNLLFLRALRGIVPRQ